MVRINFHFPSAQATFSSVALTSSLILGTTYAGILFFGQCNREKFGSFIGRTRLYENDNELIADRLNGKQSSPTEQK
jgi:hypothetical protein